MADREDIIVPPDPESIGRFIDNYVPAGYAFATMHDNYVDMMVAAGWPDLLVNIPSMPGVHVEAVVVEATNNIVNLINPEGSDFFPVDHDSYGPDPEPCL